MTHPVVWFEVIGDDGDKLRSFYAKLFDWKIDANNPTKYGLVEAVAGRGIPGGVADGKKDMPHPGVTFYVSTRSVDRSLEQAKTLGGKVLLARTPVPGGPTIGMFADPEGHAIGLVEEECA